MDETPLAVVMLLLRGGSVPPCERVRTVEALEYWRRALEVQPNFGMTLCNRAIILAAYAEAFEDTETRALFLWVAHKEASAALAPAASYTSSHDEVTRNAVKTLKAWIESVLDVEGIASAARNFQAIAKIVQAQALGDIGNLCEFLVRDRTAKIEYLAR
jgi:hypothetical protein